MVKNKSFKLQPKAAQDLENIYLYSIQEFGSERTESYIKGLNRAFNRLTNEPSLGRDYRFVRPNLFAFNVVSHVIFFKRSNSGIIILRVLHQSMDYARHLHP